MELPALSVTDFKTTKFPQASEEINEQLTERTVVLRLLLAKNITIHGLRQPGAGDRPDSEQIRCLWIGSAQIKRL